MPDSTTTEEKILENALAPKRASGDTGSMEQHSIADQIAADRYQAAKTSVANTTGGLRFLKMKPPGA